MKRKTRNKSKKNRVANSGKPKPEPPPEKVRQAESPAAARRFDSGVLLAMIVGMGIGLAFVGFSRRMEQVFDPTTATLRLSGFAMFIGLAMGPLVQPWLARLVLNKNINLWRKGEGESFWSQNDSEDNLSLMKTAVGGLALVAGLGVAILPLLQHMAAGVYRVLVEAYLLPGFVVTTLELVLILACAVVPFALLGWLLGAIHAVVDAECRWNFRPAAAALTGAMLVCIASAWTIHLNIPGGLYSVVGAIPLFLTAILSTHRPSGKSAAFDTGPEWSGRMGQRELAGVRISVFCASMAVVGVILLWSRSLGIVGHMDRVDNRILTGVLGLFPAAGIWLAEWKRLGRAGSLARYGMRYVVGGVLVAAGPGIFVLLVPPGMLEDGWRCPVFVPVLSLCAGLSLVVVGITLVDGWRTVLDQAGSLRTTGGELIAISLAGAACSLLLLPTLVPMLGSFASLVAMALLLVGCGGVLIIHDSMEPSTLRYRMVIGVVSIVLLMAFLLPGPARNWGRSSRGARLWYAEGQWLSQSCWDSVGKDKVRNEPAENNPLDLRDLNPVSLDSKLLFSDSLTRDRRITILGTALQGDDESLISVPGFPHRYAWDPSLRVPEAVETGVNRSRGAMQWLRMNAGLQDVIVLDLTGVSSVQRKQILAAGVIDKVYRRLALDGFAVIVISVEDCSMEESFKWAHALEEYDVPRGWTCIESGNSGYLVWVFGNEGYWKDRWDRWGYAILRPASQWNSTSLAIASQDQR